MKLVIVPEAAVREVLTLDLAFEAVSHALISVADAEARVLPVVQADGGAPASGFGIKTATVLSAGLLGFKVGSYFPDNEAHGLPNHGSTTMLLDAETGLPRALVSAGRLNGFRTAAANAVAVSRLAREDASTLGVLGAGHQAEFEVRAVAACRPIGRVVLWSRSLDRAQHLAHTLRDLPCTCEVVTAPQHAVEGVDILTTVTPSTRALVEAAWVAPGTHISAMGADAPGKQELAPDLLSNAQAFADLPEQSATIGEFQHPVREGRLDPAHIVPIGDVLAGRHHGREGRASITVFDSSGVAPQDLYCAAAVLEAATARGLTTSLEF